MENPTVKQFVKGSLKKCVGLQRAALTTCENTQIGSRAFLSGDLIPSVGLFFKSFFVRFLFPLPNCRRTKQFCSEME